MAITLTNNWIILPETEPLWMNIQGDLTDYIKSRKIVTTKKIVTIPAKNLYAYSRKDGYVYIPIGLYPFFTDYIELGMEVIDKRTISNPQLIETKEYIEHIFDYQDILPGITLRKEQLMAIRKILYAKRGIIQMATGAGKSEVICGTCKILSEVNKGKYPTVLILEPTVKLVGDMVKRFHKYGLPVVAYSKTRVIHPNMINVAHPKSLGIDLSKNPNLLSNVEVLFGDETHHMQSDTFRIPTYSMSSLIYSIGVSASAINQDRVSCKRLGDFTIDELLVMGSTGPLLMNITAEYLINKEDLAKPILLRLTNPADELLSTPVSQDWHEISKVRLESMRRNSLICKAAKQFSDLNRKVLILVNTIEWSQKLLGLFDNFGLSERVFASYGSNKFQTCHNGNYYSDKTINYFDDFESGKYNIMIGTSHLYEGADIKNLDVIILAFGGKAERLQVQGLGRALRKSKTGKYAYVVDFTDYTDNVLSYQSSIRFKRYKDIFGIPNENIYDNIPVYEITKILSDREDDIK